MSIQLIQQYYAKVVQLICYGGTRNESTLRKSFQDYVGAVAVKTIGIVKEMPA